MTYQLTPEHAKLWLPVVRKLREYYEGKNNKFIGDYPLCDMADKITSQIYEQSGRVLINCSVCPWFIFEGYYCLVLEKDILALRGERDPAWCKQSISRLKRWERELEKIVKGDKNV